MENSLIISMGSVLGLVGMFYTWHKDSKDTAKQIQKLETEVEQLKEHKQDIRDLKVEISEIKGDMNVINLTLSRVDTNITHLMEK